MDITDYIELPFERSRRERIQRAASVLAGAIVICVAVEKYNGSISRAWKSVRRGLTAAIAAWIEDRGGIPLFTIEGEEPPELTASTLDFKRLVRWGSLRKGSEEQSRSSREQPPYPAPANTVEDSVHAGYSYHVHHLLTASSHTPNFFQSTKFFACLDVEEANELFHASTKVSLQPHEVLFRTGDPSDNGIFIVVRGTLGVFLEDRVSNTPVHANTLKYGESVGDVDVVDGQPRSVTCIALEQGCTLVQISHQLFMEFVTAHPRALLLYLQQGIARLWRVAHFMLNDFLQLELHKLGPEPVPAAAPAAITVCDCSTQTDLPTATCTTSPPANPWQSKHSSSQSAQKSVDATLAFLGGTEAVQWPHSGRQTSSSMQAETQLSGEISDRVLEESIMQANFGPYSDTDNEGYGTSPSGGLLSTSPQSLGSRTHSLPLPAQSTHHSSAHLLSTSAQATRLPHTGQHRYGSRRDERDTPDSAILSTSLPYTHSLPVGLSPGPRVPPTAVSPSMQPSINELIAAQAASTSAAHRFPNQPLPLGRTLTLDPHPSPQYGASPVTGLTLPSRRTYTTPAQHAASAPTTATAGSAFAFTGQQPLMAISPSPTAVPVAEPVRPVLQAVAHTSVSGSHTRPVLMRRPSPAGPVCRRLPSTGTGGSAYLLQHPRACLKDGWDVTDIEDTQLDDDLWDALSDPRQVLGTPVPLPTGTLLQDIDWACGCFYLLVEGHLLAERRVRGPDEREVTQTAIIAPGSLISCAAFLSSTATRSKVVALEAARLVSFSWPQLEAMVADEPELLLKLLLAASFSLGPIIRRFICLGLNRVWLKSGDVAYMQGEPAESMYVVISGRIRLLHESSHPVTGKPLIRTEEEVGRGEAVGAVWALTNDAYHTTALCVRDSELVRMSRTAFNIISRDSPLGLTKLFTNVARRLVASWESRVRVERMSSSKLLSSSGAARTLLGSLSASRASASTRSISSSKRNMITSGASAERRGEIVTIAILPAGMMPATTSSSQSTTLPEDAGATAAAIAAGLIHPSAAGNKATLAPGMASLVAIKRLSLALKEALSQFGPVLLLNSTTTGLLFPTAMERLDVLFYRSKLTSWMAAQEEEYRFILLEGDASPTPWSSVCVAQADCILLVAPEGAQPVLSLSESTLVFGGSQPSTHHARASGFTPIHLTPVSSHSHLTNLAGAAHSSSSGTVLVSGTGPAGSMSQRSRLSMSSSVPGQTDRLRNASLDLGSPTMSAATTPMPDETSTTLPLPGQDAGQSNPLLLNGSQAPHILQPEPAVPADAPQYLTYLPGDAAANSSIPIQDANPNLASIAPEHSSFHVTFAEATQSIPPPTEYLSPQPSASTLTTLAPQPSLASTLSSLSPIPDTASVATSLQVPTLTSAPTLSPSDIPVVQAQPQAGTGAAVQFALPSENATLQQRSQHAVNSAASSPTPSRPHTNAGLSPSPSMHSHTSSAAPRSLAGMAPTAAQLRRVELVMLHSGSTLPTGTSEWLASRPHITRHHHIRIGEQKDIARLARWMAGKAVGLVLSGGGSRGLAHLGVLCALEDQGIPVDCVGGTSQGAFMAGLFAQGLTREQLQVLVREYARRMGSVQHLLSDLTLPILSMFSGKRFDEALAQIFAEGPQRIEDLWLPFFCVTTNLTRGEPSVHQEGLLWRLVRASMTIVGLLPPVSENGDLLVDGGYMNNIPVDVMRSLGVDVVIVVDVEGKDDTGWKNLAAHDGGVSGWRILWDRWCPVPSWRFNLDKMPKYSQIINKLTWMTHAHNLKRVSEDYRIDLYLRPPNINFFKLMDYHLMDRLVKDAYKYASHAISQWKQNQVVSVRGIEPLPEEETATVAPTAHTAHALPGPLPFAPSPGPGGVMCMTQLQKKQQQQQHAVDAGAVATAAASKAVREAVGEAPALKFKSRLDKGSKLSRSSTMQALHQLAD